METFIQKLEILEYDSLVDWLASALSGRISISGGITPDHAPAADLFHLFKDLQGHLTLPHSIKRAICELLDRFAASPDWEESGYQKQLLLLAGFMHVADTAARLAPLVRDQKRFLRLSAVGRTFVMNVLHDLPGSDDPSIWKLTAKADPALLGSIAFSALLRRHLVQEALAIIQTESIPDEPLTARTLATKLRLVTPSLPETVRKTLVVTISKLKLPSKPLILDGFRKWLETQPAPDTAALVHTPRAGVFFEGYLQKQSVNFEVPPTRCGSLMPEMATC
jgi:hypothetical protein